MKSEVAALAYKGEWNELLALLRRQPDLVNSASEPKGYAPLHQAAWHGASLTVIGELLSLGANPAQRTRNKMQSPRQIAGEKHPRRDDLQFLLDERPRNMAQLMRKVATELSDPFDAYDGNQVLFDRLIDCFGSDSCESESASDVDKRISSAFVAITGKQSDAIRAVVCGPDKTFQLDANPDFWSNRFVPLLRNLFSRASCIPLEKHCTVVSDIFDPPPHQWGMRGDLFLWMEMRQVLCHVPLPEEPQALEQTIMSAYKMLTGVPLEGRSDANVSRYDRGGMSSGIVSGEFWATTAIPLLQARSQWLFESWRHGSAI
ncbi:ankyrin repeat domain-containing protein [Paraburkholderia diazotrophica]|uniref:Uncharacterized protein n=1 Tax=Paraburkholderia diazotrophica TaxID=667676 RepID=A0A1H7CN16_9BURK|nr:ankyrin repeat domain-containing protein [Paraburkholderia diazotrophica]SEJ91039.1 hypothetical protein SAMN05192539_102324 [Paraburkholderia diazotrophica]